MIYLVTHGNRFSGCNPGHTLDGKTQIVRIREDFLPQIPKPPLVVVGTGRRFLEIYRTLSLALEGVPVNYSPFCGSADSMEEDHETIMLASGDKTTHAQYLSLIACMDTAFLGWRFLSELPDNTLLCAGGELMVALGLTDINERGQLYRLDPYTRTGRKLS